MSKLRSFYRPHKRVTRDNLTVNLKTGELVPMPSMTKQEFVRECDINNIIKQYSQTGMISHINAKAAQGAYTDLPDPQDFQAAINLVIAAEGSFASLPSRVRERFGNEPERFLAFMADPKNEQEARELGLLNPIPSPPPGGPPPEPAPAAGAKE